MLTMKQLITCIRNNQPQPKTLLCWFSHYFPKTRHFLLVWHVCLQPRGTAWARCTCKHFIWRGEPVSSNIFPQLLRMTAETMASWAHPAVIAVQVALNCSWSVLPGETHLLADGVGACFPLNGLFREKSFPLAAPVSTAVPFKVLGWNTAGWSTQSEPSNS